MSWLRIKTFAWPADFPLNVLILNVYVGAFKHTKACTHVRQVRERKSLRLVFIVLCDYIGLGWDVMCI